jgi:hypothetical protein
MPKKREYLTRPEISAALLVAGGKKDAEVVEETGIALRTLARLKNNPAFVEKVTELTMKAVSVDLIALAPEAIKVLAHCLNEDNAWVRIQAAREILSRVAPVLSASQNTITVKFENMMALGAPPIEDDAMEADGGVV